MKGIFRLTTFKDVSVVSGCGVGGGSLGYANTLYVPPNAFFEDRQWADMTDWASALAPHYAEAQRMLGVVENPHEDPADQLLRELGEELGVGDTYKRTPVGIFFGAEGEAGKTVPDPFFDGEGPERTGCRLCGRCMVGCPHGAKNTLVKNYLYFAEKRGAQRDARTHRRRHPPARRSRRQRRLRGRKRALGRVAAQGTPRAARARRRRLGRTAGHEQAAAAVPHERLAAAHLRAPGRARAHELRVDPRGDGARGLPGRPDQTRRDHLLHLPRPAHAHRDRHLRRRRRLDAPPEHAARRRRHARDAPAEAARADRCCTPSAWRR